MTRLFYSRQAQSDLQRLTSFLAETDPKAALLTIDLIEEAVNILQHHPWIGRRVDEHLRELIISRGHTGYVALYSHEEALDACWILAICHQREAGYTT